jgi:hypothetical protein
MLETNGREILADQLAVSLFEGLCVVEQSAPCLLWGWISSQLVFIVDEALREFYRRHFKKELPSTSSHPPSAQRLRVLRESLVNNEYYVEVGQVLERMCADILKEACNAD